MSFSWTDRTKFIGGSDASGLLGLSKWQTPLQVYLRKIGEPVVDEDAAQDKKLALIRLRGKLAEPVILQLVEAEHGLKVTRRSTPEDRNYHKHKSLPFIAAEVDFEWEVTPEIQRAFPFQIDESLIGTVQNGETKSMEWMVALKQLGQEGTDEIPVDYFVQAMHGLMVTGRQLALVPIAIGYDPMLFWVKRDEKIIAGMLARESAFWHNHVLPRVPPPVVNLPDVYRMLRRSMPQRVAATPEVEAMIQTLRVLSARQARTEEAIEAVKFEIGTFVLGAEALENPKAAPGKLQVMVGGRPELTIALQEQERIDADAVRAGFPDAAAACAKTSRFFTYNLRRSKT